MSSPHLREGFRTLTPYLLVEGADKLIAFVTEAFGGVLTFRRERPETDLVMHAEMKVGDSMLMLADATDEYSAMPSMIFLYVPDVDQAYARALAAGAKSVREPTDEEHGDRMCGVADPVGNQWWIASPIALS